MNGKTALVGVVIAAIGGIALWQYRVNQRLAAELIRVQNQRADFAQLRAERGRLAAGLPSSEEVEALHRAADESDRLREELHVPAPASAPKKKPSKASVPWTNLGSATPANTFHTVLWAAAESDAEALANLVFYDAESRARVDALFARLPEATRASFGSADQVFATLMVTQIPAALKSVKVLAEESTGLDEMSLRLKLEDQFDSRERTFRFKRIGGAWRLHVPAHIVSAYETILSNRAESP